MLVWTKEMELALVLRLVLEGKPGPVEQLLVKAAQRGQRRAVVKLACRARRRALAARLRVVVLAVRALRTLEPSEIKEALQAYLERHPMPGLRAKGRA